MPNRHQPALKSLLWWTVRAVDTGPTFHVFRRHHARRQQSSPNIAITDTRNRCPSSIFPGCVPMILRSVSAVPSRSAGPAGTTDSFISAITALPRTSSRPCLPPPPSSPSHSTGSRPAPKPARWPIAGPRKENLCHYRIESILW